MFLLFAVINSAPINIFVYLLACMFKSFLQIMSMELESMKVGVCAGNAKSLPQGLCQLTLPLAVDENSHCSASTLVRDIICILNFCHFISMKWCLVGVLICTPYY